MRSLVSSAPHWPILIAVGAVLVATGCGAERRVEASGASVIGPRYGISVALPESWYGELSRGALIAATFPVPPEGSVGLREMAFPQLEDDDARLLLFETARENRSPPTNPGEYPQLDGYLGFEPGDFGSMDGNSDDSALSGHGFARRTFRMSERLFVVFVETGARPPDTRTLDELNALLRSFEVQAGDFYPGRVEPPRFGASDGWHVGTSGAEEVDADGEYAKAWASTIPFADEWNALPPFETLKRLPRDGIVVLLGLSRTNRFPAPRETRDPPFELREFERVELWEGQVRNLPEYRLWGTVAEDAILDLRVYFGRPDPSSAMLAEAQAMLDSVELPDWGPWELEP
jgi:hypothetical protein